MSKSVIPEQLSILLRKSKKQMAFTLVVDSFYKMLGNYLCILEIISKSTMIRHFSFGTFITSVSLNEEAHPRMKKLNAATMVSLNVLCIVNISSTPYFELRRAPYYFNKVLNQHT